MPACFEVLQECRDIRNVQVFDSEFADVATLFCEELQQEFDTVAVAAQCVRAESPLWSLAILNRIFRPLPGGLPERLVRSDPGNQRVCRVVAAFRVGVG
jgi:hypothetical protein